MPGCGVDSMRRPFGVRRVSDVISRGIESRQLIIGVAIIALLTLAIMATIPPLLLDLLLALSLGAAAGMLMVTLATSDPLELTSMPPVLVLTSLFRIVLCVCASRMILIGGGQGTLIATLGSVAGGADAIVAVGLLVVLSVVQLVMVTGGVGRMSEVAARFALDALPGKQMGLDTAVGAGHLSSEGAHQEVRRLEAEAGFYGAMDGAGRLLRGEAVAAIVIVTITAFAGAARAVGAGAELGEAASRYALLATGQGLVTLLPALVMGAGAAVMVSRSAGSSPLVAEVGEQMLAGPWPLVAAATVLIALGLFPGVAKLPTLGGGGLLLLAAVMLARVHSGPPPHSHRSLGRTGTTPELTLELGMGLLALTDEDATLMDMLSAMRRSLSDQLGIEIPPLMVRDSLDLGASEFAVLYRAGRLATGTVRSGGVLAIAPHAGVTPDEGHPAELPDGRRGVWTTPEHARELARIGFAVLSPAQALVEQLRIALHRHAAAIIDLERASALLEQIRAERPALASAAEQVGVTGRTFHAICRELLWQGIPLRDAVSVVESMVEALPETHDPEQIALMARPAMAGMISGYLMVDGHIRAVTVARELHEELADAAYREAGRTVASMMPARSAALVDLLRQIAAEHGGGGPLAVIAEPRSTLVLQSICREANPLLVAVRPSDLVPDAELEYVANVEASQLA